MKPSLKFKAELHQAKVKIAGAQFEIARRRAELLKKIVPFIKHPDDRKAIEMVLKSKNITPRYW